MTYDCSASAQTRAFVLLFKRKDPKKYAERFSKYHKTHSIRTQCANDAARNDSKPNFETKTTINDI